MGASENLRVVEDAYAAFGRGDIPALLSLLTDDVEWAVDSAFNIAPWHGERHGLAEIASFFTGLSSSVEFEDFAPVSMTTNDDEVIAVIQERTRGLESGYVAESRTYHHFKLREGKICYFHCSEDTLQTSAMLPRNGITWMAPIAEGQTDQWRQFVGELNGARRDEHRAAMKRWGMRHEVASLMQTPTGDVVCLYHESDDLPAMFAAMATSNEPHDVWFRDNVMAIHGMTAEMLGQVPPANTLTDLFAAEGGMKRTQPA